MPEDQTEAENKVHADEIKRIEEPSTRLAATSTASRRTNQRRMHRRRCRTDAHTCPAPGNGRVSARERSGIGGESQPSG